VKSLERFDGRKENELREIKIERHFTKHAQGSVLIATGQTRVICTAMIEDKVPPFLRGKQQGWVTAEYGMLPASTDRRKRRDRNGKTDGRTVEIQRLIGRSLRSIVDLNKLGERTIWIDCDVIQADGGTRTASITGAYVALYDAVKGLMAAGQLTEWPLTGFVASTSVGVYKDTPILDLCYEEDSNAMVDMNLVMTDRGEFIEVQGTGEERPFTQNEFNQLLTLGQDGINQLIDIQKEALGLSGGNNE